jgi:hypothetical protein
VDIGEKKSRERRKQVKNNHGGVIIKLVKNLGCTAYDGRFKNGIPSNVRGKFDRQKPVD